MSVLPKSTYLSLFSEKKLVKSAAVLKTYTGESIPVVGEIEVRVQYNSQALTVRLVVVSTDGHALLGSDLLRKIKLDWSAVNRLSDANPALTTLLDQHKAVFAEGLGTVKTNCTKLHLCSSVIPKFCKARSIPFTIKDIIGAELDSLEAVGILEKVSRSDWATPTVTVPKKDESYRS